MLFVSVKQIVVIEYLITRFKYLFFSYLVLVELAYTLHHSEWIFYSFENCLCEFMIVN